MKIFKVWAILFFLGIYSLKAQTVGVTQSLPGAFQGYTFFSPFSSTNAYLVDNCGRLINHWDRNARPGLSAYFLENGLMMRTYKVSPQGPFNSASNAGGLELVDWDNNVVWYYEWNTSTSLSHHDAMMMPNGNILWLIWDVISADELIELGRNPNEIAPEGFAWNERIVEIELIASNFINIVWEWKIRDHYIQDFDSTRKNYGNVSEHPELFNINLPDINSTNSHADFDYNHFNAIDYNEELDQILISTRNSDEIWILDHSTTTQEAAGHSGGQSGKGGDILYRWGNPAAYERGSESDQQLFGQHGVNWIKDELEDEGKILIFNNGNERPGPDYSQVQILSPPIDSSGAYELNASDPFGPETPDWTYGDLNNNYFLSSFLSNAQRLPNGNTLINAGSPGNIFEINPADQIVWQYEIPLNGDSPIAQGGNPNNNANFRAYKYAEDFPGFEGKDVTPGSLIEFDNNPPPCDLPSGIQEAEDPKLSSQFFSQQNILRIFNPNRENYLLRVFSANGTSIFEFKGNGMVSDHQISIPNSGIFFVNLLTDQSIISNQRIFVK